MTADLPVFELETLKERCFTLGLKPSFCERVKEAVRGFRSRFPEVAPSFCSRAPGRVNIIGEHIDYNGYGVLPIAITQDVIIVCGVVQGAQEFAIANVEDAKFPAEVFNGHVVDLAIAPTSSSWTRYVIAGLKAVFKHANFMDGMSLLVHGSVPQGSGLSSSSALVCAAAAAAAFACGCPASKKQLAEWCAEAERWCGVQGGGMDHTISLMGQANKALRIDFNPLRAHGVQLPDQAVFVLSDSLTQHSLGGNTAAEFNRRVVECKLAALLLAQYLNLPQGLRTKVTLAGIQQALGCTCQQMVDYVQRYFHEELYTLCEVAAVTNQTVDFLQRNVVIEGVGGDEWKVQQRALHVFTEAQRVDDFIHHLQDVHNPKQLELLGKLMTGSQDSCKDLYECSCRELDRMVSSCLQNGALGARLTGAGWGGWVLSLVSADHATNFVNRLVSDNKHLWRTASLEGSKEKAHKETTSSFVFATRASTGAFVIKLAPETS